MRYRVFAGVALASCLAASVSAHADLLPGTYQLTSTVTIQGMSQPQTQTHDECIKGADAKDPAGHMLRQMSANGQCTVGHHSIDGGHLVADFTCSMQGHQTSGHLDVMFTDKTIDGSIAMEVAAAGQQAQHVTTVIKAMRKGDCS
ncbi:DUF3617 domain-containing protein [Acidisphaera rubrifaciens]|uniref:DUF3617 domain-containing protein n=1 Tax=Acidisphaera rubrifaciens TaxID=50715 RepID=UPI00130DB67D|nr:DUF3617 family protein [Acidisphaera rubrifaciens]